jgi:DNA-binding winged helix-turn-helix (wHTH) protein
MRVRFGSFVFDSGARELVQEVATPGNRADSRVPHAASRPVHLSPKAFDVLEILLARRPNVVNKEVLLREVWPGKIVEEANLAIVIGEIRRVLGDDSRSPSLVVTAPRHGYRFAAEAEDLDRRTPAADPYMRWWLTWRDKTLPLHEGENFVGRHPACSVWINAASVSRAHARILVKGEKAIIEDRESRNGTFVDGKRIAAPHVLVDGSTVMFGSETVTFRQWSDEGALGTEPVRR